MIGRETRMLLRHYLEQGASKSALARQLGSAATRSPVDSRRRSRSGSRHDARAVWATAAGADQTRRLQSHHRDATGRVSGVVGGAAAGGDPRGRICRRLYAAESVRAAGRPTPPPEPVIRFETPAGRKRRSTSRASRFRGACATRFVVLGYSRCCVPVYPRQDMRTLIDGLEDAFRYFGVPQELLFDQMKAVITRDLRLQGGALVRNLEFLRFAHHWSFTPRACRPYRAQTKGKVERPVRYLRDNFVYGRTFANDADLDQQRRQWLDDVANVRVHGTTRERPRDRFDRDERLLLQRSRRVRIRHSSCPRRRAARRCPAPRRWSPSRSGRWRCTRLTGGAHESARRPVAIACGRCSPTCACRARSRRSTRSSTASMAARSRRRGDRAAARRADPAAQQPTPAGRDALQPAARRQAAHRV